jgi:hypothetical protein
MTNQITNITNYFMTRIEALNTDIANFLCVILSIDETYYGNHEIRLKSRKKSELFCQLHLGVNGYRAQELIGENDK